MISDFVSTNACAKKRLLTTCTDSFLFCHLEQRRNKRLGLIRNHPSPPLTVEVSGDRLLIFIYRATQLSDWLHNWLRICPPLRGGGQSRKREKYDCGIRETQEQEWLCWRDGAAIYPTDRLTAFGSWVGTAMGYEQLDGRVYIPSRD
jgi:hypothetical protein